MKKNVVLFALLILVGAIFGSFFTYQYYLGGDRSAQASPTVTPDKPGESAGGDLLPVPGGPGDIVGSNAVVLAARKLGPSVVFITTQSVFTPRGRSRDIPPGLPEEFHRFFSPYDDFYNRPRERTGSGSGIIISSDGLILTNQHVIQGADEISVKIDTNGDGENAKVYKAQVVGEDKLTDIALIKVEAEGLKAAVLGDSDSAVIGEWVIAVGNPYGYEHTVTVGVLSAKGRDLTEMGREYPNLLQTDAAINPGNSGGPLANLRGEVIGVNTAIHRWGQGIGFAIPINRVKEIKEQLQAKGKVVRPFIGINMMEMDEPKATYLGMPKVEGVLVYQVIQGSPADLSGLQRADVILEVGGKKVNSPRELQEEIRNRKVGDQVKLKIWREKKMLDITVKLAEMPVNVVN